tara:strand:+ start:649 stop:1251 length:603 start_codon:yes stop_codon:yes gene_type:complete
MDQNKSELFKIFSTPIWTSIIDNHEEVNSKMIKYIKLLQSKNPKGIAKSNVDGWHSEYFDLNADDPRYFLNSIKLNLDKVFNDMGWDLNNQKIKITNMWSIINNKNASNARHIHSNNYISAAYYIKAPTGCGNIIFYDPRNEVVFRHPKINKTNNLNSNVFSIEPKDGLLVLFPSYLHHSVDLNNSDDERIVISFNINII